MLGQRSITSLFTLELRRERLLVLLVLECHGLRPLQLFVYLIRHHTPVHHPAHHGDQQETLEDPALPPWAHPVSHVGPAPLPAIWASKPRLCCWKLPPTSTFYLPVKNWWRGTPPLSPVSPRAFPRRPYEFKGWDLLMNTLFLTSTHPLTTFSTKLQSSRSDFRLTSGLSLSPRRWNATQTEADDFRSSHFLLADFCF